MRYIYPLLFMFTLLLGKCFASTNGSETSDIQGIVLDSVFLPISISTYNVELVHALFKTDFTQCMKIDREFFQIELPYGEYILRINRSPYLAFERRLIVMQPKIFCRVFLELGTFGNEPRSNECRGNIVPMPPKHTRLWIRIISIIDPSVYAEDAVINGSFQIKGLPTGEYMVVVMMGKEILYMKQIIMRQLVNLTINIHKSAYVKKIK
jgi:hypothetical protein